MPWNWPVEVNYLEAKAFCNGWKAAQTGRPIRMPSEEEWMLLRDTGDKPINPGGTQLPATSTWSTTVLPARLTAFDFDGFYDVIGNVWQWTETPIHGLSRLQDPPHLRRFFRAHI